MTGKLTKSQGKYIKSLQQKKYRDLNKMFVVEGMKMVQEALQVPGVVEYVVYVGDRQDYAFPFSESSYQASSAELKSISSLKTPNKILAVCSFHLPFGELDYKKSILALDEISDPGNLGTILRLADWFGLDQIICAPGSVDVYNPKVVQATMGSIFRVYVFTKPLLEVMEDASDKMDVFIADMEGKNLYEIPVSDPYMLIMGSEAHGVSLEVKSKAKYVVSIPRFGSGESLNVAVSTGIILSEFKRKLST